MSPFPHYKSRRDDILDRTRDSKGLDESRRGGIFDRKRRVRKTNESRRDGISDRYITCEYNSTNRNDRNIMFGSHTTIQHRVEYLKCRPYGTRISTTGSCSI